MAIDSFDSLAELGTVTQVATQAQAPTVPDVLDKAAFLAHLIEGAPFSRTYDLFGGELSLEFQTVTAAEYSAIKGLLAKDDRYTLTTLLALASLKKLCVRGVDRPVPLDRHWTTTRPINAYLQDMGEIQLRAIEQTYARFEQLFLRLLREADSPHFTQTP